MRQDINFDFDFDSGDMFDLDMRDHTLDPVSSEYDLVECETCEGEGEIEGAGPRCTSMGICDGYCGGCYPTETCDDCHGFGVVVRKCEDCGEYIQDGKCFDAECETNS